MSNKMHTCPECRNEFLQPLVCITCGAERLYDATVLTQAEQIARLTAERDEWRDADRAECEENQWLVQRLKGCGDIIIRYQSEFSRLDYALGAPNDNRCSLYDVDCDEERVVNAALARLAEAERTIARLSGFKS